MVQKLKQYGNRTHSLVLVSNTCHLAYPKCRDIFSDTFMSKTARLYRDTRTANAASSNLDKLNDDLQDVTRIMTKNMEELLWRGDSLDREFLSFVSASFPNYPSLCRNVASINVVTLRVRKIP